MKQQKVVCPNFYRTKQFQAVLWQLLSFPILGYNLLRATDQTTANLTSTCLRIKVKDNRVSLRVTCDQHIEPPAIVGFLDQENSFLTGDPTSAHPIVRVQSTCDHGSRIVIVNGDL